MKKRFVIINGPNLNVLGLREPEIYGSDSLKEIEAYTKEKLANEDIEIEWFQSNIEGEIVDKIQQLANQKLTALIINPGAYSHTSIAIHDALKTLVIPVIEVHLSHTTKRESFRSVKLTAKASTTIMEGLGKDAYHVAIYSQLNS